MTRTSWAWVPAAVLGIGALCVVGVDTQRTMSLESPLGRAIPDSVAGWPGRDVAMSASELRVSGVSDYLFRIYEAPGRSSEGLWVSLYVGFYGRQKRGQSIHSPKNCLPGSGWQPLASKRRVINSPSGEFTVNHYVVAQNGNRALVLYWYQGRGRVQPDEYLVKLDLLLDAALRGRSEEALVRVVVPYDDDVEVAQAFADQLASLARVSLDGALPAWP